MVHLENPPLEQAVRPMPEAMDAPKEYRPSNSELLKEYEIRLQFLSRGCIVQVGCKNIAFETVESAMKEVNEYVNNPFECQQKWRKILS